MKIHQTLLLTTALMLAGCSQQGAQSAPPSASSPQQNASAPTAQTSSTLHHEGCTIEMVKVCQAAIDQQQFVLDGVQMDARRLEQSSTSHVQLDMPVRDSSGALITTFQCQIDAHNRKVNWTRQIPGPTFDDKSWAYAKSKRWCQEDAPDYSGWAEYWRGGVAAAN